MQNYFIELRTYAGNFVDNNIQEMLIIFALNCFEKSYQERGRSIKWNNREHRNQNILLI